MPDLHHSISIAAPPDAVRGLVSTPEGLRQWWAEDVEAEPGGGVALGFFNRTTVYRLRPAQQDTGTVSWHCETGKEWQDTDLVFRVAAQGSGTVLDFVHAKWAAETPYFVSCNTTWGGLMFRIKQAAEGRRPGPLFQKSALAY